MRTYEWIRGQWRAKTKRLGGYLLSVALVFPCMPASPALLALASSASTAPSHNKVVMAYAYEAKSPRFADRDAQYLTHIIWSFGLIVDGKVSGAHWRNIDTLKAYKQKHPHIKTLMAIGGWGADGFSQAAATPEGREAFVTSAVALAQKHGFDGIDIDWEYPGNPAAGIAASPDDKKNFTLLLRDLRQALDELTARDGRYRLLTVAVGASAECVKGIDCSAISRYIDYMNIMSYDLAGGSATTGHHTNLFSTSGQSQGPSAHTAVEAFVREGMPLKKLVIGAAFYGHMWKGVKSAEQNGLRQQAGDRGGTTVNYASIMENYYGKNGYQAFWDDAACAPYLFNGENFISFDNEHSVRIKGRYARERGLAGVMFWEYTHDPSGALLKAIDAGLRGK